MANRTSLWLLATVFASLTILGCGGKKNQQDAPSEEKIEETQVWLNQDSTIYGLCGDGSAMNTLQLITDTGDTLNLSVAEAKDQNHDRNRTMATLVINQSELLGNWVMPNPLDGSNETGISIREGGIAESIEQSVIIYRTWRITNGLLEIVSIREGGGEEEETNLYEILSLGNDSLVYKTVGKPREEEETFEYSRQVIHEHVDKVKLEESSFDDFKM